MCVCVCVLTHSTISPVCVCVLPHRWFHGCITRQETVSRLKGANIPHCYLVRESQTKLGTYVLSYMAQNNYVHHFRIHTICGDYYIGNRQFLSLQDLIGYYSRNYVVEDGFLQYPVPPPQVSGWMRCLRLSIQWGGGGGVQNSCEDSGVVGRNGHVVCWVGE